VGLGENMTNRDQEQAGQEESASTWPLGIKHFARQIALASEGSPLTALAARFQQRSTPDARSAAASIPRRCIWPSPNCCKASAMRRPTTSWTIGKRSRSAAAWPRCLTWANACSWPRSITSSRFPRY
jgi:hypothetical protein